MSRPLKAPPTMNRMSRVSRGTVSPLGFLRPPFSGTFTVVPSSILSSACCTPSPLTSLVMLRSLSLITILSICRWQHQLCPAVLKGCALDHKLASQHMASPCEAKGFVNLQAGQPALSCSVAVQRQLPLKHYHITQLMSSKHANKQARQYQGICHDSLQHLLLQPVCLC